MGRRVQIGDIVEIPSAKGFAYAQYTHTKPALGALIRVMPGFYATRPTDFDPIMAGKERFCIFLPLQQAVSRGIFQIVARAGVPRHAQGFPVLRGDGFTDREGRVHDWWIWDGDREWRVASLTPEQRGLSPREVWNDTLLIQRVEEEWTPEQEVARREAK